MKIKNTVLLFYALMFLTLGSIPVYFDLYLVAASFWLVGLAIFNIYVYIFSTQKS